MQLANVIGHATATLKHATLRGWKLIVVQPLLADGSDDGHPLLVIDPLGSRRGDRVIVSSDSQSAREMVEARESPVRWMIVAMVDE